MIQFKKELVQQITQIMKLEKILKDIDVENFLEKNILDDLKFNHIEKNEKQYNTIISTLKVSKMNNEK